MKKEFKVGDIVQVRGNWDRFFEIDDLVNDKRSLAILFLQIGNKNESIQLLSSAIAKISVEIDRAKKKPSEDIVMLNLRLLMLGIYSDLAYIYHAMQGSQN